MNYMHKLGLLFLAFLVVAATPMTGRAGPLTPETGECYGTMTATREAGFTRIAIGRTKTMIPAGWRMFAGSKRLQPR